MIKRERYLKEIREFYDIDLIKVITGIRRSGKSVLLKQIIEEIGELGIKDEHIIYINFEDAENSFIKNYQDLHAYINDKIVDEDKYYLFFDEVQRVIEWEKAINSFKSTLNVSLFVTGSNSNLLSGELTTLLTGRYVSFTVRPFTFKEAISYLNITDKGEIADFFDNFILWGGMPQRFDLKSVDATRIYLSDTFDGIINKDIEYRSKNINIVAFKRVIQYFVTNPSQIFSPSKMIGELAKEGIQISTKTIYEYLELSKEAFLLNNVSLYDIRGKRILSRKDKYYLTDLGLGQVNNTNKKPQYGAYLENLVYNELLYRGYDISFGSNDGKEIDFVAIKNNNIEYYQVAYTLGDEKTENREFSAYDGIADNYPKYVISTDKLDYSQNGIIHKNIIDWLLEDSY